MPKARVENQVANDGAYATIEMKVTERETTKTAQYRKPVTFDALTTLLGTASDKPGVDFKALFPLTEREPDKEESEQAFYLRLFNSALANWARADVYQSLSSESTMVTIAGQKVDLMTVPVPRLIKAYNNNMGVVEERATIANLTVEQIIETDRGFKAWRTAARKLVEGYTDADGDKIDPQARYGKDGLSLEPLAA